MEAVTEPTRRLAVEDARYLVREYGRQQREQYEAQVKAAKEREQEARKEGVERADAYFPELLIQIGLTARKGNTSYVLDTASDAPLFHSYMERLMELLKDEGFEAKSRRVRENASDRHWYELRISWF